jgi:PAS domain S-box-containing protein
MSEDTVKGNAPVKLGAERIQQYYDNILASLIDGIVVVDRESRIITFSAVAEQMTCLKASSVEGKTLGDVFGEGSPVITLMQKTLRTGRS